MTIFSITQQFLDGSFSSSNSTEILMGQFCVQNFSSIGCNCEELSCKRTAGRTHWLILECTHPFWVHKNTVGLTCSRRFDAPWSPLSNGENRSSLPCSYQKLFEIKDFPATYGPSCISTLQLVFFNGGLLVGICGRVGRMFMIEIDIAIYRAHTKGQSLACRALFSKKV
jgi:hypothetical protein